eukprot:COSAG06_NODE_13779_length_1220_cov_1.282783_1_plen_150_part_10
MKGVTVESNGHEGLKAAGGAVAQVQGCTMRDNKNGDYVARDGGRIENLDLTTAEPESEASGGSVGPSAGGGSGTMVATESELRAAVKTGGTVVVKAGARIELAEEFLPIQVSMRLVGERGAPLPTIAGPEGSWHAVRVSGQGVVVELEDL